MKEKGTRLYKNGATIPEYGIGDKIDIDERITEAYYIDCEPLSKAVPRKLKPFFDTNEILVK